MLRPMKKRVVATVLWAYAFWYAGALIAELFGFSPALGPILAAAAGLIIGVDPRHIIWTKPEARPTSIPSATATTTAEPARLAA